MMMRLKRGVSGAAYDAAALLLGAFGFRSQLFRVTLIASAGCFMHRD